MVVKPLNFKKMNERQLRELYELDLEMRQKQQDDNLAKILETTLLITNKKGRGKTLTGIALSYGLRERYGRPVIAIGSKMGIQPAFGPYQDMDEKAFKEELERLTVAASEEENAENVALAFEKYGVSILYATIVFDEARKLLNSRRAADKLVQLVGDYVMQSRHYHNTIIILAPAEDEIDKRVVRQVDWKGRCFHNKYTGVCRTRLTQGLDVVTFEIDGYDDSMHAPFFDMYNSWALLGYRSASLQINRL